MPNAPQQSLRNAVPDYQHLAAAVIKQAIADALDPLARPEVRHDAWMFLRGSGDYRFWCRLGGLDPNGVLHTLPPPAPRD